MLGRMIRLEEVTKTFGSTVAVDHVSADFERGRTHVLLGSSGCGKSTLLRLILGLIAPTSGTVEVDGRGMEPATRPDLLEQMGYVVQEGGLFPHLTAYRNVSLAAESRGWREDRIAARIDDLATPISDPEQEDRAFFVANK